MAKTTWQKIDDKMKQLKGLHQRMDTTMKLLYPEDYPFKLRDFKDQYDLDNVINVTGNQAINFGDAIVSDLMSATWQTVVEGDISSRQAHDIEQFIEDNFEQADEVLLNKFGMSSLYDWLCNHVCFRGLIGVRWLSQISQGQYETDCLPIDMRWCAFQWGRNGLSWVAPVFFRNKEDILEEYPDAKIVGESEIEVRDYWDAKRNEVWVARNRIFDQRNTVRYPPFVIVFPPSGFMLRDKGYLKHEAEDIFYKNRKLYDEMNRSLSIEQTIGMDILYPPYEYETDNFDATPARPVPKSGETKKVPKGERHQPVPRGDLNRASITAREDIYRMIELGGISDAELGSARLDRPGIWFAKQFEIRHKLEKARFQALAMMKEGLARMMIKQFIASAEGKEEIYIGRTGRRNKFSVKMLGDPDKYRISFRPMISSKEQEIVNLAQAQAAIGIAPMKIIVRDILKAEDPDGWMRDFEMEQAKKANPAIGLAEMAVRYAEEAEDTEDENDKALKNWQSMMLVHDYVMMMRARMQPQVQPEKRGEREVIPGKANLQGLVGLPKLLGGGGMVGGRGAPIPEGVTPEEVARE